MKVPEPIVESPEPPSVIVESVLKEPVKPEMFNPAVPAVVTLEPFMKSPLPEIEMVPLFAVRSKLLKMPSPLIAMPSPAAEAGPVT